MPVIVIGADTPEGAAILPTLEPASGEVRMFVTDPDTGTALRNRGKVAIGDVSDGSHVGGAALGAFCAVAIARAACDQRERSFADSAADVFAQWADGLHDAGITRIIFVATGAEVVIGADLLRSAAPEFAVVDAGLPAGQLGEAVALLEQAQKISGHHGAG
jgi:hypothetical protein